MERANQLNTKSLKYRHRNSMAEDKMCSNTLQPGDDHRHYEWVQMMGLMTTAYLEQGIIFELRISKKTNTV